MFVAQVEGSSMEPQIPNGSYCLFSSPVTGTRQGKTILAKLHKDRDPESGANYTVKKYESESTGIDGSVQRKRVILKPANRAFEPIVFTDAPDGEFAIIAELVEVLGREGESEG
ncbi:MAG TPA: S24 family peptidase [Thermoanaerobaculia bacterium]|nr:S24 family peptidase [Thermoanaerobaculia bacterium]